MKTIGNIIWIIFGGLHIDWHTVRKDAFPTGKTGPFALWQRGHLVQQNHLISEQMQAATFLGEVAVHLFDETTLAEDDTEDRIFLLSEAELSRYFPETKPEPRAFPTRYAMDQGVELLTDGSCGWWLRTSGSQGNYALTADDSTTTSAKVNEKYHGVRPAMWVSIET